MTGTIWTNKLKKRLKMTDNDHCEICTSVGSTILEDAEHVLGGCTDTRQRHDQIWQEILNMGKRWTLHTESWTPWFSTSLFKYNTYNTPLMLGNKGLTPKLFRTRVIADNTHINKPTLNSHVNEIIKFWRWAKKDAFINCMRDVTAGRDGPSLEAGQA